MASTLPTAGFEGANFLNGPVRDAAAARLAEGDHSGIIEPDRLERNLLSSQPLCFNLFGPYVTDPDALLPWVRSLDSTATSVSTVQFEWAPPRDLHFGGGSAFDVFITYSTGSALRFLGVECKYAENLADSRIQVRDTYKAWTTTDHGWRPGATDRLDQKLLRQFWLNTLLAQSLVAKDSTFEAGQCVIVACAADHAARQATESVRDELTDPDSWLRWSPYEDIATRLIPTACAHNVARFVERYLDFGPVTHLLPIDDPRRTSLPAPLHLIRSLDDLLTALEADQPSMLDDLVDEYVELDGWVDWDQTDERQVTVAVNGRGTVLEFPIVLGEFWDTLDSLDAEVSADLDEDQ